MITLSERGYSPDSGDKLYDTSGAANVSDICR
jgi:hypothetical protein